MQILVSIYISLLEALDTTSLRTGHKVRTRGRLGSTSAEAAPTAAEVLRVVFMELLWELGCVRLVFATPEFEAAISKFFSLIIPIVLDVSDLESSRALGRAGGILAEQEVV